MPQLAVVSGTTHGIGRVTCFELAKAGYAVVMLCRDTRAADQVRTEIRSQVAGAEIGIVSCDLSSQASVRQCAETVRRDYGSISRLINNAGMASVRHQMSTDGFELTFATNHLGPFLLTRLLTDRMQEGGRIITVASRVHYRGKLDLATVQDPRARYGSIAAYARSKLANVMFSFALARRLAGTSVTANCLHPGVVATNLLPRWVRVIKPLISRIMFDPERGAQTSLYLALSPALDGVNGRYFDEHQRIQTAAPAAEDVAQQEALWQASERWTGLVDGTV